VLPPGIPNQSKGTLFEGGVRVPFFVSGAGVAYPGSRCYALVQAVDVFNTTLDAMGIDPYLASTPTGGIDGISLLPYLERPWARSEREFIYAQRFEPNGPPPYTSAGYMVRDARWKFVDRGGPGNLFFDLASGSNAEQVNLLDQPLNAEQTEAIKRLRGYLKRILM
jgi:arylsulfatase A-like enzyme